MDRSKSKSCSTLFERRMDLNDAKKKEFILNVKLEATNHSSKVDALDWKTRMADKMERIGFLIEERDRLRKVLKRLRRNLLNRGLHAEYWQWLESRRNNE